MRDIFKKLRCGGTARTTSSACEATKDESEKLETDANEEADEKDSLLNGNSQEEEKVEDAEECEEGGKKSEENADKCVEDASKCEEETEEKCAEEEKTVEENHIEDAEEAAAGKEDEEGEKLLKSEEDEESKECEEKKSKKKEPSKWMCGLGKKSSDGKEEKKKQKKSKSPVKKVVLSNKDEVIEDNGDVHEEENEENQNINGEEEEEIKHEVSEENDSSENATSKEPANDKSENEKGHSGEEVVVFVTEGETVVEEKQVTVTTVTREEFHMKGEGLIHAIKGVPVSFEIHVSSGDASDFECKVRDANGNEVATEMETIEDNVQKVTYCPDSAGLHSVEAVWKGNHVIGSPFQVEVTEEEAK